MDSLLRAALERRDVEHEAEMAEAMRAEHSKCRYCTHILRLDAHRKAGIHPECAAAEGAEGGKAAHARKSA